jgi:AraC-like DNA-binding protein
MQASIRILAVCVGLHDEMSDRQSGGPRGSLPPTKIAQFTSADIDLVRSMLNRFFYPTAIGAPEGADTFKLGADLIRLGPLTIGRLSFAAPVTLSASELDAYHVTMPTAGRCLSRHAGKEVTASPGTAAVFGPGNPVYTMHDADSTELDVKIERSAFEAALSAMLDHPIRGPVDLPPMIHVGNGLGHTWRRLVQALHDESNHPDGLINQPLIGERLRHLIVSGLLVALPHRYQLELHAVPPQSSPRAVRRVRDAIESEPERPFTVADLAAIAGVSVRSLQDGFRRHLDATPMGYLQEVRLRRAHDDLLTADPLRDTVSTIAHRWGFVHLGRFASAYRVRYHETPSETLRKTP